MDKNDVMEVNEPTPANSYAVFCHTCDGKGKIEEEEYPTRKKVLVTCPECNGQKFVYVWR